MKFKKNIAKLLTFGLLLNNVYFYSNANTLYTEIPNRYQTLEGEYITIDDSTVGELYEIEIFGNTIQDENNLENIQSVGDLYVDENGKPILDSQGREQYKIDIFSRKSIERDCKKTYEWENGSIRANGELHDLEDRIRTKDYIDIGSSKYINLKFNTDLDNSKVSLSINMYNENKESLGDFAWNYGNLDESFSLKYGTQYIKIKIYGGENSGITPDNLLECKLYSEDYTNRYKETLILPAQLMKVGDIADRLYWDNSKDRYLIEKNVSHWKTSTDTVPNGDYNTEWELREYFRGDIQIWKTRDYITDCHKPGFRLLQNSYQPYFYWRINKIIADFPTIEECANWYNENQFNVYTNLEEPKYIETNITSKLVIPTYDDKTYIYVETENGINPTLKITVDKMNRIAQDTVMEVEEEPTISKLSLARNIVNQMDESILKDQLQARLNSLSSLNDMQLERKATTANLDIYIKSENMLSLSLDTNSVTFENYSGVEDMEIPNAINISINSSLPYSLNAYIPSEIQNSNKSETMPIDMLNIKEGSETNYKQFTNTTDRIILKDNCDSGNNNIHNVDLKLASNQAHKPDVYKTTIKFEAVQK